MYGVVYLSPPIPWSRQPAGHEAGSPSHQRPCKTSVPGPHGLHTVVLILEGEVTRECHELSSYVGQGQGEALANSTKHPVLCYDMNRPNA